VKKTVAFWVYERDFILLENERQGLGQRTKVPRPDARNLFCRSAAVLGRPRRVRYWVLCPPLLRLQLGKKEASIWRGRPRTAALRQKRFRASG